MSRAGILRAYDSHAIRAREAAALAVHCATAAHYAYSAGWDGAARLLLRDYDRAAERCRLQECSAVAVAADFDCYIAGGAR